MQVKWSEWFTSILSVGSGTTSSLARPSFSGPSPGQPVLRRPGTFACGIASPTRPPGQGTEQGTRTDIHVTIRHSLSVFMVRVSGLGLGSVWVQCVVWISYLDPCEGGAWLLPFRWGPVLVRMSYSAGDWEGSCEMERNRPEDELMGEEKLLKAHYLCNSTIIFWYRFPNWYSTVMRKLLLSYCIRAPFLVQHFVQLCQSHWNMQIIRITFNCVDDNNLQLPTSKLLSPCNAIASSSSSPPSAVVVAGG